MVADSGATRGVEPTPHAKGSPAHGSSANATPGPADCVRRTVAPRFAHSHGRFSHLPKPADRSLPEGDRAERHKAAGKEATYPFRAPPDLQGF